MSNNPRYMLERIIEIQNIVLEHKKRGVSQIWTYRNVIYPRFYISEASFKRYMGLNAKKALKEYEQSKRSMG